LGIFIETGNATGLFARSVGMEYRDYFITTKGISLQSPARSVILKIGVKIGYGICGGGLTA